MPNDVVILFAAARQVHALTGYHSDRSDTMTAGQLRLVRIQIRI
jgi:hypothetical protein